jgi:MGT family glycosyltransferase
MRPGGRIGDLAPMARLLFASVSATGHVNPMLPLARELADRGHDLAFYVGDAYRDRVEAVGATHLPILEARDSSFLDLDDEFPERAALKGIKRFKYDMREIFLAAVPGQAADLLRHTEDFAPDVLVVEPAMAGAADVVHQRLGVPYVTSNISALMLPSPDVPPFGLGLAPARGPLGRARNRLLNALVNRTVFRAVDRDYRAMADRLGIEAHPDGMFSSTVSPYLTLQPTVPSFEFPRAGLPPQLHFIGPMLPPAPPASELPAWWDDLATARHVVLVTQGTVATDPRELLLPTLEALRDEDVLVVAVTGGPDPSTLPAPPANARVERFVPFDALMPHVSALVTNGGYGGLHFALAHGVPVFCAGATEEKPELVARVRWSGVGLGARTQQPRPAALRAAIRRLLDEPGFAARAREVQAEMARYDGPRTAASMVEEVAATGRPVLHSAAPHARPVAHAAV